uniref:Uncharacterized protein n=1 Tax=Populus trichocarpa TaxID=3694 RepID=A0A2K1X0S9_POPTR
MIRLCVLCFVVSFFFSLLFCWLSLSPSLSLCLNIYFSLPLTSKNGKKMEKSSYVVSSGRYLGRGWLCSKQKNR